MNDVPVIGLVGGVGSGKSSLARAALNLPNASSSNCGSSTKRFVVISGDEAGHRVLEQPDVREAIRREFGDSFFDGSGQVIRSALARVVFGSSQEARSARAQLERIVHPRIQQELTEQIHAARTQPGLEAVLLDAAVLLEAGWDRVCTALVFVEVSFEERLRRVQSTRGWSEEELRRREESQWPLEKKRARCSYVVLNEGSLEESAARFFAVLERVLADSSQERRRR